MCMSIPMRVQSVDGLVARCEARGEQRTVGLEWLLDEGLVPGDVVAVHLNRAVRKLEPEEAEALWALFDQLLAHETR